MLDLFFKKLRAGRKRQRRYQWNSQPVQVCEPRLMLSAVNVTTTPGPGGAVNVVFDGTDADDQIDLGPHYQTGLLTAYDFGDTTFRLNGGPEVSQIVFNTSISNVTFNLKGGNDSVAVFTTSVRDLNLNLGAGNDSAFIVDANVRDVNIQDGVDASENNSYNIQTFASSFELRNINAQFDAGSSGITIDAFTGQSIGVGKVQISGQNFANVGLSVNADSNSHVQFNGDVQIDAADFGSAGISLGTQQYTVGDPGTVDLRKDLEISGGDGGVVIGGNTDIHGKTSFVTTGFGSDQFRVESGAPVFEGAVNISTGEGDDYILMEKFDSSPATEFHSKVTISTGNGNDIVNIGPASFDGTLSIDLGNNGPSGPFGVDNMRLGAVDVNGKLDVTTTGQAILVISPPAGSQAHFRKDASFTLGGGQVYVDSSNSNVIFDKAQTFVGQPNRIQVRYIGNVIANLSKLKLINADFFTS